MNPTFLRNCSAFVMLGFLCSVSTAADPAPPWDFKSKAAKDALVKYNKAVEQARKELIQDLEAAKDEATRAANLSDALKITNSLKFLENGEDPPRKFKLQDRLRGTRWAWGKNFEDGKIRLHFATTTYTMIEPVQTLRGDYVATSPYSVRFDGERDLIFSRDFKRFVLITSEGEIRTGLRLK